MAFSADLSRGVLERDLDYIEDPHGNGGQFYPEGFCDISEEVLDPREPPGSRSVFVRDLTSPIYQLASLNEDEGAPGNSLFLAGSEDFSTIAIVSEAQLTADAVGVTPGELGGWNQFVWSGGVLRLATILPDGTPVQGELAHRTGNYGGAYAWMANFGFKKPEGGYEFSNALSKEGSKLFFTYGNAIYMRVNPAKPQSALAAGVCTEPSKACTVQVDESQGPGASGGGTFEFANADGSKVFFTSDHKMTPDSTAVAGKEDLYEYDTETGDLTDLTVNASEPADVWAISDISEDGSYVYFVAEAALEGSGATTPGSCEIYSAASNTCNLYVRHNGVTTYIASIGVDDSGLYGGPAFVSAGHYSLNPVAHHSLSSVPHAESSPDGRYFAFNSFEDILGEGNGIYVYDAVADQLSCISCDEGRQVGELDFLETNGIYPATRIGEWSKTELWRRSQVLDNGSVFFTTDRALLSADTNGESDAYGYEDGQLHLFSTGVTQGASNFVNATPSGSDVYFASSADLVSSDLDGGGMTLYDARINGGFPEPPPLPGCEGEACRGAGTGAPPAASTGSAAFQGAGNQTQHHKRNCGLAAKRAQKLARAAKSLRRQAESTHDPKLAKQLRQRSAKLAKQGRSLSKSAKRCRRANRGVGK